MEHVNSQLVDLHPFTETISQTLSCFTLFQLNTRFQITNDENKSWYIQEMYFKSFNTSDDLLFAQSVWNRVDKMAPKERYYYFLKDTEEKEEYCRVYAFLQKGYNNKTYVVASTIIHIDGQKHFVIFAEEYTMGVVWGTSTSAYLLHNQRKVGGRYTHCFWN